MSPKYVCLDLTMQAFHQIDLGDVNSPYQHLGEWHLQFFHRRRDSELELNHYEFTDIHADFAGSSWNERFEIISVFVR
jgi:hypothetical protein